MEKLPHMDFKNMQPHPENRSTVPERIDLVELRERIRLLLPEIEEGKVQEYRDSLKK